MRLMKTNGGRPAFGFGWAVILLLMPTVLAAQEKIAFYSTRDDGNGDIFV